MVCPWFLVRGITYLARHVGAPGGVPTAASALDGLRVLTVVQADHARELLPAHLPVPAPLPVLDLACLAAVKRLLAPTALLPATVVVHSACELLPARRARPCGASLRCAGGIICGQGMVGAAVLLCLCLK